MGPSKPLQDRDASAVAQQQHRFADRGQDHLIPLVICRFAQGRGADFCAREGFNGSETHVGPPVHEERNDVANVTFHIAPGHLGYAPCEIRLFHVKSVLILL